MVQSTTQFQHSNWYWQKVFLTARQTFTPTTHKFYKIFNRNNVKVSCSLMPNSSSIIKSHNKNVLSNDESKSSKSPCNCTDKSSCPLNGNCLQQNVIYCGKFFPRNQYINISHFGMGALLYIWCIFSEHLFLRTPLGGCFCLFLVSLLQRKVKTWINNGSRLNLSIA